MEIFAAFETWHLGDGNYPPLKRRQLVNLSFEIEPDRLTLTEETTPQRFHHCGQAEYDFTGVVLRVYREDSLDRIVVVEADQFRFYLNSTLAKGVGRGDYVSGRGTLTLDHYPQGRIPGRLLGSTRSFLHLEGDRYLPSLKFPISL